MHALPVSVPTDPWCRAGTRLMLTTDGETGQCYLGLTPDGEQPGRDMLARLSLWRGETELPYRTEILPGCVRLQAEGGAVTLSLGFPEYLAIRGEGVSLLIGKGRAVGMFMSGGSAVDDPLPGALYVNAGARMRILPKTGSVEVRSAWDLNALSDPDPRVFLHPDAQGKLTAAVYVTDFDADPAEAETPAPEAAFERFLASLTDYPKGEEARHAAYVVWSCLQPARALADAQMTAPLYVISRRRCGTARQSDNVLFAALLADPAEAARQLCAFLPYRDESGLIPTYVNCRSRLYEAETPWYGLVLRARPDILPRLSAADFGALKQALGWWQRERRDPETGRFFYRHRYEPGLGRRFPFPSEDADALLNACLRLWLEAMAALAERLGSAEEAAAYKAEAETLPAALWTAPEIPEALALPLLLTGDVRAAAQVRADARPVLTLRRALTVLAAGLAEGGARDENRIE